jgi:hypothetical protein
MKFAYEDKQAATREVSVRCECGVRASITVPVVGFNQWVQGTLIQRAMPQVSPEDREFLISRTCPDCWNAMMPQEEDN